MFKFNSHNCHLHKTVKRNLAKLRQRKIYFKKFPQEIMEL